MLLPYRTDAPVYYTPYATIGLILANFLVFGLCVAGSVDLESLALEFGTLNPIQWVTANFAHLGPVHLLGNMIVLWPLGLVVEGKLGAGRFLLVYFGMGLVECAIVQLLMLGAEEGMALGSSGIIFGLFGIAMIWAPKNHIDVFFWAFTVGTFTITIEGAAYLILGLQIFYQVLFMTCGTLMTSALLHLLGAAIGIQLGISLLRRGHVDCEGWDWFSVQKPPLQPYRDG